MVRVRVPNISGYHLGIPSFEKPLWMQKCFKEAKQRRHRPNMHSQAHLVPVILVLGGNAASLWEGISRAFEPKSFSGLQTSQSFRKSEGILKLLQLHNRKSSKVHNLIPPTRCCATYSETRTGYRRKLPLQTSNSYDLRGLPRADTAPARRSVDWAACRELFQDLRE